MEDTISRKKAIDAIKALYEWHDTVTEDRTIDHLKRLPSVQPETHEERTKTHACDLISRKDAIDAHYEYCNKHPDAGFPVWSLKILEDLPSAQPELPEWAQKVEEYRKSAPKTFSSLIAWALYQTWREYAERRTDDKTDKGSSC